MICKYFNQSCHLGTPHEWEQCAAQNGTECDMLKFGWGHCPDSPWGDVDICAHGVCRTHGTNDNTCKWCDSHSSLGFTLEVTGEDAVRFLREDLEGGR